jgi:hypothetical protein
MADRPDLVIEPLPNQDHRELADLFRRIGGDHQPTDREQRVPRSSPNCRDAGTMNPQLDDQAAGLDAAAEREGQFQRAKPPAPRGQLTVSWSLVTFLLPFGEGGGLRTCSL